jgi:hypothetical protein
MQEILDSLVELGLPNPIDESGFYAEDPIGKALMGAAQELVNKRYHLVIVCEQATGIAAKTQEAAKALIPRGLNSLGELRAVGPRLDALCAEVNAAVASLRTLAGVYKATRPADADQ